jgi:hypothetical protein
VFNLPEFARPAAVGFDAVFNGTTNFIIDAMAEGSFDDALAQTRPTATPKPIPQRRRRLTPRQGVGPANVAMKAPHPDDVEKQSLRDVLSNAALGAARGAPACSRAPRA